MDQVHEPRFVAQPGWVQKGQRRERHLQLRVGQRLHELVPVSAGRQQLLEERGGLVLDIQQMQRRRGRILLLLQVVLKQGHPSF